ncbi:MAG: alpha/beta fold hydrolase [Phenylobacterium sp.]
MLDTVPPPADADPQAFVTAFERRARRHETPCGDGVLVWRSWGSGPPLLLLHGARGSWTHWIRNIDALGAERTVWVPDLPGHGDSAAPAEAGHAGISAGLAAGLSQLIGPDLPVDLVGFSFGGVVGAQLAARHPGLVRRIVIVDSGGIGTPLGRYRIDSARGLTGQARRDVVRGNLLAMMIHDPARADDLAVYLQDLNSRSGRIDVMSLVAPTQLTSALRQTDIQADAIWGDADAPHPNPEAQAAMLRRIRPDAEFHVIPGAGHWSMYERADLFNPIVLELLRKPLRERA